MILTDYNRSRDDCRKNSRKISFELYELETVLHEDETEKFVPATVRNIVWVLRKRKFYSSWRWRIWRRRWKGNNISAKISRKWNPDLGKAKLKIPFFWPDTVFILLTIPGEVLRNALFIPFTAFSPNQHLLIEINLQKKQ